MNYHAPTVRTLLAPVEPVDPTCACGEPINEFDAPYIAEAGFPEFAHTCKHCMPEDVRASLRRFYRGGVP